MKNLEGNRKRIQTVKNHWSKVVLIAIIAQGITQIKNNEVDRFWAGASISIVIGGPKDVSLGGNQRQEEKKGTADVCHFGFHARTFERE